MNLIDLLNRKDSLLKVQGRFKFSKTELNGSMWRVVDFTDTQNASLVLDCIDDTNLFRNRETELGWYACSIGDAAATITVALVSKERTLYQVSISVGKEPVPVLCQWPVGTAHSSSVCLRVSMAGPIRLFVHRVLTREPLYQLAKGSGIEIGPGPKPQILSSSQTSVKYLEELPQEEWAQNDKSGKYGAASADWSNYIIGKASKVPVADSSIDYIFSSHLFEHLANPLGHLVHWRSKLRVGGVVIAVVPDMASCKDYRAQPSSLSELVSEMRRDIWEPEEFHFRRFAKFRKQSHLAERFMKAARSIHVHFYTERNMPAILGYAVSELGFKNYDFIYERNHKDFHFILYA